MVTGRTSCGKGLSARLTMPIFLLLFTLFAANVLLVEGAVSFGWDRGWLLGDLGEFILLLAAAVTLSVAGLARERRCDAGKANKEPPEGEESHA